MASSVVKQASSTLSTTTRATGSTPQQPPAPPRPLAPLYALQRSWNVRMRLSATMATLRIVRGRDLRCVRIVGRQTPFCEWSLVASEWRANCPVTMRGRTRVDRQHPRDADWSLDSFALIGSEDGKRSLGGQSIKFCVRAPTLLGYDETIGVGSWWLRSVGDWRMALGTVMVVHVPLRWNDKPAGRLTVELLY